MARKKKAVEGQILSPQPVPPAPIVVESTCIEVPPAPALPGKTINWTERFDRRYAETKAKLAAQKALFVKATPPVDPAAITSDTPVEGKTVGEWAAILPETTEAPGWAIWAVREWKARGSPTPKTKVLDQITALREDAEKLVTFANLDKEKATKLSGDKAKKLLKAAEKKSDKAMKLFDEADKIARESK